MRPNFFEEAKLGVRPKFGAKPTLRPKVRPGQVLEYTEF